MNYKIRKANHLDASKIISAHRRSIREVCMNDYNAAQIAAWSGRDFKEERWCQNIDKDMVWVIANDHEDIFGFGHLKFFTDNQQAEIAGLYFTPEVIGQGFGRKMIFLMLEACSEKALNNIILTATITALKFYIQCGFTQIGNATTIKMGDQLLECFNMKRIL